MTEFVLRLFDLFAWALRRAGVDYPQFRALLEVKLTIDGRRQFTAFQQQGGRTPRHAFGVTLFMNVAMGAMIAMFVASGAAPLIGLTVVQSFVMVMVTLSLVADFSAVLLDTTDNQILQPRPISSRTILAARTAHIATYVTLLTLSLTLATFVAGTWKYGAAFPVVFAASLFTLIALVLSVVNVVYLLLMRITDGERLRDMILYVQIGTTILTIGGYQLLPRLLGVSHVARGDLAVQWWVYLVPPAWFAAPVALLAGEVTGPHIILAGLGILAALGSLAAAAVLAPGFKEALARLDSAPTTPARRPARADRSLGRWARWLTRRGPQRAAFELLWVLTGRDRMFKLRTYPNVALAVVLGAVFVLSDPEGLRHALESLPTSQRHLLALYMACALAPTGFLQIRFSDRYEAAWLYRILPLAVPGDVLLAALKVIVVRLMLPTYLLIAVPVLAIWGPRVIPDEVLALCAMLLVCGLQGLLLGDRFPFSEPAGVVEASGRANRAILYLLLAAMLGGLHYLLAQVPWGVPAAIPVVAGAAWWGLRTYGRTGWRTVLKEERAPARG